MEVLESWYRPTWWTREAKEKIMPRKNKIDPSVFFDLAAEGAGPRTGRADGVTNREVTMV